MRFVEKKRSLRDMKKHARESRQYAHYVEGQPEGSKSTHLMATYEADEKYFVAPTITTTKEGYETQSFEQAKEAGELYEFDSAEEAEKFAAGSWKKGKDLRKAMREYRRQKRKK
tara:strand:+ start:42 stop:383 length:342 start_codon:yes stop_codon:yes gene_type:complete